MPNTYLLLIKNSKDVEIKVGSLGEIKFSKGWFCYVGSSRTSNFSRLTRHSKVSIGENSTRHWHIDYLNGYKTTTIEMAYISTDKKECKIAEKMKRFVSVNEFGCSDCKCDSHLFYSEDKEELKETCEEISMASSVPDEEGIINLD